MEFRVIREYFGKPENGKEGFTKGTLLAEGTRIAYTVEDEDRHLETDGEKVYGKTAIPRGRYRIMVDFSHRFQKPLPHIMDVPKYEGVRVHGGNRAEQSLGCILIGTIPTPDGVANCLPAVKRIIELIEADDAIGKESWISIV